MLRIVKGFLGLSPKTMPNDNIQVKIGVQGNKIVMKFDRAIDTLTLDKTQVGVFLGEVATRATLLK